MCIPRPAVASNCFNPAIGFFSSCFLAACKISGLSRYTILPRTLHCIDLSMYGYVNIGKLPHLSGYSAFIYTVFLIIFVGTYFRAATKHYENWYSTNISETTVKFLLSPRCSGLRKHRVLFSSVWIFPVNTKQLGSIIAIQEMMSTND